MSAKWEHRLVVYRIDLYAFEDPGPSFEPSMAVTIKEIVNTEAEAEAEVERLNNLNAERGCKYFWQCAKYYPEGR